MRVVRSIAGILIGISLTSCAFLEKPKATLPSETIAAPVQDKKRLVIVLPGRGDNLAVLKKSNIASAIQKHLPNADVTLVEMTLAYYMEGRAVQRLHDEIVQPAKQHGYSEIYLAGASMGGMGVLMYEREYPNEMTGLILMAPYMGDAPLIKEIKAAGGLAQWEAGPVPAELNRNNVPREEWRLAKTWLTHSARAKNVWLVCGQSDRFHSAAGMVAVALPSDHYVEPEGGHAWSVWTQGANEVFARIETH